ncbi:MAG TPA: hypothetical protein EYG57_14845 [Planctomycetes bacterium]|nr:hypothetical protein [Planctomycetaceae bacterium]HIM30809.1 hypothetical protein [Planctomycetota bacterium]
MSDVIQILSQIEQGDRLAAEQLLPLVYHELRRLAVHEKQGQTLQATALVHEAGCGKTCASNWRRTDRRAVGSTGDRLMVPRDSTRTGTTRFTFGVCRRLFGRPNPAKKILPNDKLWISLSLCLKTLANQLHRRSPLRSRL